jgi:hypothetical protein
MREFFVTNNDYENGRPANRLQNDLNKMAGDHWLLLKIEFYQNGKETWVTCIYEREKE